MWSNGEKEWVLYAKCVHKYFKVDDCSNWGALNLRYDDPRTYRIEYEWYQQWKLNSKFK